MNTLDLCPMCGVMRGTDVTGYRTTVVNKEGVTKSILTRASHCNVCCTFIRCEEVEDTPENCAGVLLDEEQFVEGSYSTKGSV